MTTFDYSRLSSKAAELIERYGQGVEITVVTAGTYSTEHRTVTPTEVATAVVGVVLPIAGTYDERNSPETSLGLLSRRSVLIPGESLGSAPKSGDRVVFGAQTWNVVGSSEVSPAGTTLIYRIEVSR